MNDTHTMKDNSIMILYINYLKKQNFLSIMKAMSIITIYLYDYLGESYFFMFGR
jgi:hypothetical protein